MNPIVAMMKNAVSWSMESLKLIACTLDKLNTPTITNAHVVAAFGMRFTKGCTKRSDRKKKMPVKMEASPVRAPASTPVLDST